MRLALSFLGALGVALLLFLLMLYMVAPPRAKVSVDPIGVGNFIRISGDSAKSSSRSRQQAPEPPQQQVTQTPVAPNALPSARLPMLDIQLPKLASGISISSAPSPSLAGLTPGASSTEVLSGGEAGGGVETEVVPLNNIQPAYPRRALEMGVEGYVKLAFTINRLGQVENIRVVEADPPNMFEREARRAAARWRFAPRTENGRSIEREAVKTLTFRLEKS